MKTHRRVFQAVEHIKGQDQIRPKNGKNVEKWSLGDQRIRRSLLSKQKKRERKKLQFRSCVKKRSLWELPQRSPGVNGLRNFSNSHKINWKKGEKCRAPALFFTNHHYKEESFTQSYSTPATFTLISGVTFYL